MSDWKKLLIPPDASFEEAIRALDTGGMRIALVAGGDGRLLGTVTDGDVRRALLQHTPFSEPVSRIMNRTPRTVPIGTPREDVVAIMHAHSLLQVPIVDAGFRVVGLETLIEAGQRLDNWVFLVAGGFGKRLRPLTDDLPKPMLPVGGKPILETILDSFLRCGFHRFCIAIHYKAEVIKAHFGTGERWNATIRYIEEDEPLGTAGALSLLPDTGGLPVMVMNGDLLTRVNFRDLLRFHEQHGAAATMAGRHHHYQVPFGVIDAEGAQVRRVVEKPIQSWLVNAGIYVISAEVVRRIERGQPLDMPDLLDALVRRGEKVCFFPIHEYWLDIGQMSDFERAHRDISELS